MQPKVRSIVCIVTAVLVSFVLVVSAGAEVIKKSPKFPPKDGRFKAETDIDFGLGFVLKDLKLKNFRNIQTTQDQGGKKVTYQYDSVGNLLNTSSMKKTPIKKTGSLTKFLKGRNSQKVTGMWNTEILSMDLRGDVGTIGFISLMADPNRSPAGATSIREIGNDGFAFDSFFDVFFEVEVGTSAPAPQTNGPTRLRLVPEPASAALLVAGAWALLAYERKRRRRSR